MAKNRDVDESSLFQVNSEEDGSRQSEPAKEGLEEVLNYLYQAAAIRSLMDPGIAEEETRSIPSVVGAMEKDKGEETVEGPMAAVDVVDAMEKDKGEETDEGPMDFSCWTLDEIRYKMLF